MPKDVLHKSCDPEDAKTVMAAARAAACSWGVTPAEVRAVCMGALRREIVRARDEIVRVVSLEAGKTPDEVLYSDLLPTLETLLYLAKNTVRLLRPRRAPSPMIFRASKSHVEYRPRGVVLVIAPWNNPFQLSLVPVASALAAGNAVILKPSERTPETGKLVAQLCERSGLPAGVLQVVPGDPDAAKALVDERPDMVFFTGGTANGRAVLAAAGRHLIPVILELGGKDPMIVFFDADLDRAAKGAVYGAFAHAGQHCISVKRLYVERSVYDSFMELVATETRSLAATPDWGRVMDDRAGKMALEQVQEAVSKGARLVVPGNKDRAGTEPTLIVDATHEMRIMREETFAPVLAAMRFESEEEAVRLANDSPFALNASVWSHDTERARRVVRRLETGNAYVNNVLINVGNPYLPFGGVKWSGIGRYHGPEGLRSFCVEKSVMFSRSSQASEPHWFPCVAEKRKAVEEIIELRYGEMGRLRRAWGWLRLLRRL